MNGKVTYHQQVSYCGKPRCRKCREGTGHGPYWYAYQTVEGRTTRTYIGKQLPPDAQASMEGLVRESPVEQASEQAEATVRVYMLGQFRLERRDRSDPSGWQTVTESAWQHQRVRSLLGCLLSNPGRKVGREQLIEAVWPELDAETAANRLDRAVYSLRQLFEPGRSRLATSPLLLTEREVLVLADQSQIWVDADAFEHILSQAHATHATHDAGEQERLLNQASLLFGGDFLPEERKIEWTITRRETLQRTWTGMLLELADLRGTREDFAGAIEPLDRLLAVDPTNEAAVQRLIVYLARLDRRGEALRAYKRLATVLQQEYRIAPLPDTRALYEAVRHGTKPSSTNVSPASAVQGQQQVQGGEALEKKEREQRESAALQIGRAHQSPLVGREQELEMLRHMLLSTEHATRLRLPGQKRVSAAPFDTQRRPQCVLLMGEVGIGKTRLAEEAGREVKRRGWAVAWSRVYAQEGSIPYRMWTEILRKAMQQGSWQRQEISKRPLVYQPLSTLLPEMQELLPEISFSASQSPEQEQLRLWEAARELLCAISDGTPLLIVLDDLQWADGSSCELLAYLARRIQNHPIIIIGTCRDNELPANHPLRPLLTDLQREHAVETVSLPPLSDAQIGTLVSNIPQLPEPIVPRIQTRAAGNPFFAEELARNVKAEVNGYHPNGQEDSLPTLPDTIAAVLDLRLSRLSQPCQRLLSKAAVIGGSFEFPVICAMEVTTPGSNEDIVLDLIEEALRSGMLTEEGTGTRIVYQFWHPLLVSHLYEALSAARRASLHRRAADILREMYKGREAEKAAVITHHLVNGGANPETIAYYAEMAADRAYGLSAYPEAEKHYRIAMAHTEVDKHSSVEEQLHMADLFECLGECTRVQGKDEDARGFYEQALRVRKNLNVSLANVEYQQEAQIQALLWCEIGVTWYDVGDNAQAQRCYQNGEQVLQNVEIMAGPAWAYLRLYQSYASFREGSYEMARHTANEALKLFKEVLDSSKTSGEKNIHLTRIRRALLGDPVDLGRVYVLLGLIDNSVGLLTDALSYLNMALPIFEQYRREREIAIVSCTLGDIYLKKADHEMAQSVMRRCHNLTERIGDIPLLSVVFNNFGMIAARSGDLEEAEKSFQRGLLLAEQVNDPVYTSVILVYLASVLQDRGKLIEAGKYLRRSLSISRSMHIAPCIGFSLIAVANLRIILAMILSNGNITFDKDTDPKRLNDIAQTLLRAKKTLLRALTIEGLEAETRTEGQLVLAQVEFFLGDLEDAWHRAEQTLEEARKYESKRLIAGTQVILGCILAFQGQQDQATKYFEQALKIFRVTGMQMENARTLQRYGLIILQCSKEIDYQRGLKLLEEAKFIFEKCKAVQDLKILDFLLTRYKHVPGTVY